ncbi:hypothetical protein HYFRA_00005081 [Hymenoscyphus fraxineus]|uniref:protein-L-isoaspartate(D-aspartate) O-methyltransferase n=1 Tax=Hymenoscyphus fraxineus TaxID=746836 RepID=A0A9N9L9Q1_9HELO|nr:hypothetical protein HYFRA_00005081 [Hymenoscyphus fraxineus]
MPQQSPDDSNESLVEKLCHDKYITHPLVKSAFLAVDRGQYAPRDAYKDSPQLLSHQSSISSPNMHARAAESLLPYLLPKTDPKLEPAECIDTIIGVNGRPRRVLDIGSGSGFLVHILAKLAGETSLVVGVEHIEDLRKLGETNMRKSADGADLVNSGRVRFRFGDGRHGWFEPEPELKSSAAESESTTETVLNKEEGAGAGGGGWDAIHVGACAFKLHDELIRQLRCPGRLFIPVAEEENNCYSGQYIWTVDKDEKGKVTKTKHYSTRYVWLMDAPRGAKGGPSE